MPTSEPAGDSKLTGPAFTVDTKIKFRVGPGWASGTVVQVIDSDAYRDGRARYKILGANGGECVRTAASMRRRTG